MFEELKDKAQDATQKLDALYGQLEDRAKDAGEDVKGALSELGPAIEKLRHRLAEVGTSAKTKAEETELQGHLGMMEARERWEAVRQDLSDVTAWLDQQEERGQRALERGRIQSHLARMEAEEAIAKRRETARRDLEKGSAFLERHALSTLDDMVGFLEKLRGRLAGEQDGAS